MGVHEALITNPDLNRVLLEPGNAHRTRPIALDAGMTDSWTSCLGLVLRGQVAPDALGALPTG